MQEGSDGTQPQLPPGFTLVKPLGQGAFGVVVLCIYEGQDEQITNLCDSQGRIALKLPKPPNKPDVHEAEIGQHLYENTKNHPSQTGQCNLVIPLLSGGQVVGVLSQFVSYEERIDKPRSSDLESFIRDYASNVGTAAATDKIAAVLQSNLAVTLSQFASSMHTSQATMHSADILHLDTASRNYLVNKPIYDQSGDVINFSATIADYGLSEKLNGKESIPYTVQKAPLKYLDTTITAGDPREAKVASDLFALKCSIIGMAGLALGAPTENDVLALTDPNTMKEFIAARFGDGVYAGDDQKVLAKYVENVSKLIDNCPDKNKQAEMQLFIECYSNFLTTMPPPDATNKEAQKFDTQMLHQANSKFLQKSFEAALSHVSPYERESSNELHLLAKRISCIETSAEFKQSETYKQLSHYCKSPESRARDSLFLQVVNIENQIKMTLPKYRWAAVNVESNDPNIVALRNLKTRFNEIKSDVHNGKITSMAQVKNELHSPLHIAIAVAKETHSKTLLGRVGLSHSNIAKPLQKAATRIKTEDINNENSTSVRQRK
jgi:serine/threonine protein kinase